MGSALVVLHIEGLMPFTKHLMDREGYGIHRYRCGVPSTTPFAQAGILYGDNSEIPSFRWWDREQKVLVQFGARSTFEKVADKYFQGCKPLTEGGACIAACYPAGAAEDFGISYHERSYGEQKGSRSAWRVLLPYLANPIHLGDWVLHTVMSVWRTVSMYLRARLSGRHPARPYVLSDALEEIFVHHLTRFAVEKAMGEGFTPIYAGFYAFDETGHAFGPADEQSLRVLRHVDGTIEKIAGMRGGRYELVVLSDHGQIETDPFYREDGVHLGELVAGWMPGFHIVEMKGRAFGAHRDHARGRIHLTYSGGLGHLYMADEPRRLSFEDLESRFPDLIRNLATHARIALVMARGQDGDVFSSADGVHRGSAVKDLLAVYDDADILYDQLTRLNSFEQAGDLVFFGAFRGPSQVNFENQAGGHGAFGGEQGHPFVLAKREWAIDTTHVDGAHQLHPILSDLRDRLSGIRTSVER
jgi:hypothetical protein